MEKLANLDPKVKSAICKFSQELDSVNNTNDQPIYDVKIIVTEHNESVPLISCPDGTEPVVIEDENGNRITICQGQIS